MKKLLFPCLGLLILMNSCEEETERVGCTDWQAANFDANAQVDDGSCILPNEVQNIFLNGQFGGWDGDSISAGFLLTTCKGSFEMMTVTGDSTSTTSLGIVADSNGEYNVAIELVNPVVASYYGDGHLRFKAKKGVGQTFATFDSYIYGNNAVTDGSCWQQRRSDMALLSALSMTDENYVDVSVPMSLYSNRALNGLTVVCGFSGSAEEDATVLLLDDIRWTVD